MQLSKDHEQAFVRSGFVVVEDFYPESTRAEISAAIRRDLPLWDELKSSPEHGPLTDDFPYAQPIFNELTVDPDLLSFVRRVLMTEDIHFRYAHNWARYPTNSGAPPYLHVDNGNNSLLPPCDHPRYGQVAPGTSRRWWRLARGDVPSTVEIR